MSSVIYTCSDGDACYCFIVDSKCNDVKSATSLCFSSCWMTTCNWPSCLCPVQEDAAASDSVPAVHHGRDRGASYLRPELPKEMLQTCSCRPGSYFSINRTFFSKAMGRYYKCCSAKKKSSNNPVLHIYSGNAEYALHKQYSEVFFINNFFFF